MEDARKYVLVEVIEQDISEPAFFGDQDSAAHELRERLKRHAGLTDEDLDSARPLAAGSGLLAINEDSYLLVDADGRPYAARTEYQGQNFDCRVFELPASPSDGASQDEGFVVRDKDAGLWYVGLGWSKQLREAKIYHSRRYAEGVRAKFPNKDTEIVSVIVRVAH